MNRVDLTDTEWFKSSHSNGQRACVEVARTGNASVPVRDSKDSAGAVLTFPVPVWRAFISAVKGGELPSV